MDQRPLQIQYIQHLQYLLSFPPNQKIPQHIVSFDPNVPAWGKSAVPPPSTAAIAAAAEVPKFTLEPVNPKSLVLVPTTSAAPSSHAPVLPPQVSLVTAGGNSDVITMDTTPTLTSAAVSSEERSTSSWKQDAQPTLNAAVFDQTNN